MNPAHIIHLRCPKTKGYLTLVEEEIIEGKIKTGSLIEVQSGNKYPIINFIPRFVAKTNYADNFGLEWNLHSRTQYDSTSGHNISEMRFSNETKWDSNLSNELILEAGSGSGRFTTHAVNTNAFIISFDYSNAVEANYKSNGHFENLLIIQASIYEMPFEDGYFDKVFCFGVIQHTPDPHNAFRCLIKSLKIGGYISSDVYLKSFAKIYLSPKYLIRFYTKKMDPKKLYKLTTLYIHAVWPLSKILMKIPLVGKMINWRLMVADYSNLLPNADDKTLKEWAVLDTFDMVSPAYDFPQTVKSFLSWHQEAGLTNIEVQKGYNGIEGRGVKT